MYSKPDPTPFAANLAPHETVVQLDTLQYVAVISDALRVSGNQLTINACARQVDGTGLGVDDGNGHAVKASMSHQFCAQDVTQFGAPALAKDCTLLTLGEPPLIFGATPGLPPLPADVMASYSIRHALDVAPHAGPVTDLGTLL